MVTKHKNPPRYPPHGLLPYNSTACMRVQFEFVLVSVWSHFGTILLTLKCLQQKIGETVCADNRIFLLLLPYQHCISSPSL